MNIAIPGRQNGVKIHSIQLLTLTIRDRTRGASSLHRVHNNQRSVLGVTWSTSPGCGIFRAVQIPRVYSLVFLLLLGSVASVTAAPGQLRDDDTQKKQDATSKDTSQVPLVYENVRGKMYFENDGMGGTEYSARVRVQTPAGVRKI